MEFLRFTTSGGLPKSDNTISHAVQNDKSVVHKEFSVHDTFRHGFRQVATELLPSHPLESTLRNAESNREQFKLEMDRQVYGRHCIDRHLLDKNAFSKIQTRLPVLGGSNLAKDVLSGRLDSINFDDYLNDPALSTKILDVHGTAEVHRLGWKSAL